MRNAISIALEILAYLFLLVLAFDIGYDVIGGFEPMSVGQAYVLGIVIGVIIIITALYSFGFIG